MKVENSDLFHDNNPKWVQNRLNDSSGYVNTSNHQNSLQTFGELFDTCCV